MLRQTTRFRPLRLLAILFLLFWCAFSVFAFGWIVMSSLKTNNEFFANIWGFFAKPQFENYLTVWNTGNLKQNFLTSLFVVGTSVLGVLAVSAPAAYVLSRFRFPFSGALGKFIVMGNGIPNQLLLVPLFFILFDIKLVDSLWGLILVYIALSIPFTVFLMMGFFKSLPHELEEMAMIDGCSPIGTFFRIILPLGQVAIITSAIFNFIGLWNEFLLALTIISQESKFTISLGLYALQGSMQYTGNWVALFAGFTLVLLPTFVVYLFLSQRIIEGMTVGAVKE